MLICAKLNCLPETKRRRIWHILTIISSSISLSKFTHIWAVQNSEFNSMQWMNVNVNWLHLTGCWIEFQLQEVEVNSLQLKKSLSHPISLRMRLVTFIFLPAGSAETNIKYKFPLRWKAWQYCISLFQSNKTKHVFTILMFYLSRLLMWIK